MEQDFCLLDEEGLLGDLRPVGTFSLDAAGVGMLAWGTYITVSKTWTSGSRSNICLRLFEILTGEAFLGGLIMLSGCEGPCRRKRVPTRGDDLVGAATGGGAGELCESDEM